MPEMHLRRPGFEYSACGPFTKNKEYKNKKHPEDSWYIYQNKLDKACFQHEMTYEDFKDLTKRATFDKILCNKVFSIETKATKNSKCDGYKRGFA